MVMLHALMLWCFSAVGEECQSQAWFVLLVSRPASHSSLLTFYLLDCAEISKIIRHMCNFV